MAQSRGGAGPSGLGLEELAAGEVCTRRAAPLRLGPSEACQMLLLQGTAACSSSQTMLMAKSGGICSPFASDTWMAQHLPHDLSSHFSRHIKRQTKLLALQAHFCYRKGSKTTCLCCLVFNYHRTRVLFMYLEGIK